MSATTALDTLDPWTRVDGKELRGEMQTSVSVSPLGWDKGHKTTISLIDGHGPESGHPKAGLLNFLYFRNPGSWAASLVRLCRLVIELARAHQCRSVRRDLPYLTVRSCGWSMFFMDPSPGPAHFGFSSNERPRRASCRSQGGASAR